MTLLIFGATGQQGRAVCDAALSARLATRALVRCADTPAARALAERGVDLAEALTMVFLGFPELGDTGVTGTGGPRYTNCALLDGMSGCDHYGFGSTQYYTCVQSGSGFIQPVCASPSIDVRRWAPTGGFSLVDTPVGTLTTGMDTVVSGGGETFNCGNGTTFTTTPTAERYAITTINNVTALRQLMSKEVYYVEPGQSCPSFGTYYYYAGENVMCCLEVVE